MSWINKILKGDRVIWVVMFILGVISLLAVYSATSSEAHVRFGVYNDKDEIIKKIIEFEEHNHA